MLQAVEEAQARMSVSQGKEQKQTWAESLITAIIKNLEVAQFQNFCIINGVKILVKIFRRILKSDNVR